MTRNAVARFVLGMMVFAVGCAGGKKEEATAGGEEKMIADLVGLLAKGDDAQQSLAAEALGKIGPPAKSAMPELKKLLEDNDPVVCTAAAFAVLRIEPGDKALGESALTALENGLASTDERARIESARALGHVGSIAAKTVPSLCKALKDDQPHVQAFAAEALAKIGSPGLSCVMESLNDDKSRHWAVVVLGEMGADAKSAVPALLKVLKSDDNVSRGEAALALGAIKPDSPEVVEALAAALTDKNGVVRASAAYALGEIGEPAKASIPALRNATKTEDAFLNSLAAITLIKLQMEINEETKDVVGVLATALKDEHPRIRLAACQSLATIGPAAKDALPALEEAAKDKDSNVADAAKEAIQKIKG
ncbi:MAG: HEAT repeat domain-containing protein [Planctomycetota bacterium]